MARYDYESPIDRLLNETIPSIISEERGRQERDIVREEDKDWRETVFEYNKGIQKQTREDKLLSESEERDNSFIDDLINQGATFNTLKNIDRTKLFTTDMAQERFNQLFKKAEQNRDYMTSVTGKDGANLPFTPGMNKALSLAAENGQLSSFNTMYEKGLTQYEARSGMSPTDWTEWLGWEASKRELLQSKILISPKKESGRESLKRIDDSISEIDKKMFRLSGKKPKQTLENKIRKTLANRFNVDINDVGEGNTLEVIDIIKAYQNAVGEDDMSKLSEKDAIQIAKTFKYNKSSVKPLDNIVDKIIDKAKEGIRKKKDMSNQEKNYRSLLKSSRTDSNIKKLELLESKYPELKLLELRDW